MPGELLDVLLLLLELGLDGEEPRLDFVSLNVRKRLNWMSLLGLLFLLDVHLLGGLLALGECVTGRC